MSSSSSAQAVASAVSSTPSSEAVVSSSSSSAEASSSAAAAKSYYGVAMYEQPDESFDKLTTYGGFDFYERQDDYWSVMALSHPSVGVVKLILTKTFYQDEYGTSAKAAYAQFKPTLDEKYVHTINYDFCSGSSYVCQADNYAYAIYRGERFKVDMYSNGDDVIGIELDESSGSIYDIDLKITYETAEFSDVKDGQVDDAGSNLAPVLHSLRMTH